MLLLEFCLAAAVTAVVMPPPHLVAPSRSASISHGAGTILLMSQPRDAPLSGLEAREHCTISSAAATGRTASRLLFFPGWGWPLAKSQLGPEPVGVWKDSSQRHGGQGVRDPPGEMVCVYVRVHACMCISVYVCP